MDPQKWSTIKYSTLSYRSLKLNVIIHGMVKDIRRTDKWIKQLIGQYLNQSEQQNVIVIDWTDGAQDYTQVVANSRVVGAQVAELIKTLRKEVSTSLSLIHLIGEGVCTHAAGYAGERLEGRVGRITGLSPATLFFKGLPKEVRLDSSDAMNVEIIDKNSNS